VDDLLQGVICGEAKDRSVASGDASYITGVELAVDGGRTQL
jgi:hypothetical protein